MNRTTRGLIVVLLAAVAALAPATSRADTRTIPTASPVVAADVHVTSPVRTTTTRCYQHNRGRFTKAQWRAMTYRPKVIHRDPKTGKVIGVSPAVRCTAPSVVTR